MNRQGTSTGISTVVKIVISVEANSWHHTRDEDRHSTATKLSLKKVEKLLLFLIIFLFK